MRLPLRVGRRTEKSPSAAAAKASSTLWRASVSRVSPLRVVAEPDVALRVAGWRASRVVVIGFPSRRDVRPSGERDLPTTLGGNGAQDTPPVSGGSIGRSGYFRHQPN